MYANSKHVQKIPEIIVSLCGPIATREIQDFSGDARDFDKSKWIKQNRKYPADPPGTASLPRFFIRNSPAEFLTREASCILGYRDNTRRI